MRLHIGDTTMDAIFKALADPFRRNLLGHLAPWVGTR